MKILLWLLLLCSPALAQSHISAEDPHPYGWFIGDLLEQKITLTLPESVTISEASLPRPRAVDYWLDLRDVAISESGNRVVLTLTWQNFYAAIEPVAREVPGQMLRLSDGSSLQLPGFSFVASPLRPLTAKLGPDQLRPDPPYQLIDIRPRLLRLALALLSALGLGLLLMWHQAWGPFRARKARPFTRALRQIRRAPDEAAQRRALHRAFDASYGRVLIGADLGDYLKDKPRFAALKDQLGLFFSASDAALFGTEPAPGCNIAGLAQSLAGLERGRR